MQTANLFELHSFTLKISYSASSLDGKPLLSYHKGSTNLQFRGNQLRQKQTEIGLLITVTLKMMPDARTTYFTVIIPQVNIPDEREDVHVTVKAIETTSKTTIGGPDLVQGQVQTYKVYSLRGTAKSVLF